LCIKSVPHTRDEQETTFISWILATGIFKHLHYYIARYQFYYKEIVEDVADQREFDRARLNKLIYTNTARIHHNGITIVKSAYNVGDEIPIVRLFGANLTKPSLQGNTGIADYFLALYFEPVEFFIYIFFEILVVLTNALVDLHYLQLIAKVVTFICTSPAFGINVDDREIIEVATTFEKMHFADFLAKDYMIMTT
jgi:hypothetical protein